MNIYVTNLGYSFQDDDLSKLFAEYGDVSSAKIVKDKFTSRSKGFGFVEMPDKQAAEKAIRELNGKLVEGRQLKISEARAKEENQSRSNNFNKRW